jgi:GAF domain-containing protein/anti-sigma regulatory factor (Ser/Thr protein kinase)
VRRDRLELEPEPDAVPRARRFVGGLLHAWELPQVAADVELAVTELVTNALLHAGPPVSVVVCANGSLRVAVHDPSPTPPIRAPASTEAMTGRGLALVSALSDRWGVERTERGKAVWCEFDLKPDRTTIPTGPEVLPADEVDAFLAGWDDLIPPPREPTYRVTLGDVPTSLLLAAKAHVDNVVRELTLVGAGAAAGDTAEMPAHLATVVESVVTGFAEARNAIKRQALEAASRGDERVRLTLTLPVSAADAGERYLAGLDDADAYARAARLLTLEAPPQHRVFRHWYVESLVTQLRHRAKGEPVEPPPTFEQYLLGEVDAIAAAHRATDRAARLQHIAASLAAPTSPLDVAEVVVAAAVTALGAQAGALLLAENGRITGLAGQVGYEPGMLERSLRPVDDPVGAPAAGDGTPDPADPAAPSPRLLPSELAAATGEAVWIESREERDARFPALSEREPLTVSLCVVPLTAAGRVRGVLRFNFAELRLFDAEEREFVHALAAQTAQALERAELYRSQARLADRLSRLQRATAALTATRKVEDVARVVVDHATGVLGAELGAICLLSEDGQELEVTAFHAPDPTLVARFQRFPVDADLPAAQAVRTGRPVVVNSVRDRDARYPSLATVAPRHEHTLVSLPLAVDEEILGVLNLSLPGPRAVDSDELGILAALADVCAQSLDRARALEEAQAANVKLAFLSDASAELAGSLDYRQTLSRVAQLAVPRLGDWCAVHLVERAGPGDRPAGAGGAVAPIPGEPPGTRVAPLAVAHVDPVQLELAVDLQARYPVPAEVAAVVRTGNSALYPVVTDEMINESAADPETRQLIGKLAFRSVLVVPLTAHGRVFGTIAMARSQASRPYTQDELRLAEDLARRAALAIDNAKLYEENVLRSRRETEGRAGDQTPA